MKTEKIKTNPLTEKEEETSGAAESGSLYQDTVVEIKCVNL